MVQQLGLGIFTAMAWVQPLVRELKSCKPYGVAKNKNKKERKKKNTVVGSTFTVAGKGQVKEQPAHQHLGTHGPPSPLPRLTVTSRCPLQLVLRTTPPLLCDACKLAVA